MKTIYLIGGTMGVGKTTVSQQLKKELPNSVFLDGDWCWDADPFQVTEETKAMVMRNICFLLNSFLHCTAYKNIVFCWVMHEQSIIDEIINSRGHENSKVTMDIYAKAKYNKPEELSTVVNSALKKPSKSESGAKTGQ